MSTPITTFFHWNHPRRLSESAAQHNHLSLNRLEAEQRFALRHYAIHLVLAGEVRYQASVRRWSLGAGQYLLINAGPEVKLTPLGGEVEVLCLHLAADTVHQVLDAHAMTAKEAELMTCLCPEGKIELCEQIYESGHGQLGGYLRQLGQGLCQGKAQDETAAENIAITVAEKLITAQMNAYQQMLSLNSAKLSTKRELYRRLCQARMYMHSHLDENLDLDTLSQVACLSKYHFIRLFKEAFEQTPRQYLIARRLERASNLLIHSTKTFHEICQEVGLKDSSSFGRLFKRSFGATPHLYRQMYA